MKEKTPYNQPEATVREINGHLVLDDPVGLEFVRAVGKHNCLATLEINRDRVTHFKNQVIGTFVLVLAPQSDCKDTIQQAVFGDLHSYLGVT